MTNNRDQLYRHPQSVVADFKFDENVANVFQDMITRSVPGYAQILNLIPTLVKQFDLGGGNYYDLGCSLGAGLIALSNGFKGHHHKLIGIDNSMAMLEQAKPILSQQLTSDFELRCEDINTSNIQDASMVLMNFTLQFVRLEKRSNLINKIYRGLQTGGVLVLSEKIKFDDDQINHTLTQIHHQYKADQGYSELEISQKRDAIDNVLLPETLQTHTQRLLKAGFSTVTPWVQNLQFVSILAIK